MPRPAPSPPAPGGTEIQESRIQGVLVLRPRVYGDHRGRFVTSCQTADLEQATGHRFPVAQASYSRSRRSVARGVHFTRTAPGGQKLVTCPVGDVLDLVVDLRVGSPTFGQWDSVELSEESAAAVYLPVGVGHAFVVRQEGSVVSYLLTTGYVAENELAISLLDPDLALPVGDLPGELLSERDRDAPTLEAARERGLLPDLDECRRIERALSVQRFGATT